MFSESPRIKDPAEQRLAEQLRSEALAEQPAFSAGLHARIMAEVAKPSESNVPAPLSASHSLRRNAIQWAVVAASLAAVALGVSQLFRFEGDLQPLPRNTSEHVVRSASMPSKYSIDDFNHGAGIALRLVVDQLPIEVPADDWGLPAIE